MASQQEIKDLIDKTDIVSLVSRYVKLEKQGKNYRGLCPFHSEDTPSFLVSPEKNIAHCFGCGGGGDPLKFLMKIEGLEFKDAINRLAEFNGVKLSNDYENKKSNSLTKYYNIMKTSVEFYKKNLEVTQDGIKAYEYLHKRGLTDEMISTFQIGLAPKPGNTLYQVLKDSGYLELDMTDIGLVDKNDRGYYDLFSSRIMFPIFDEMGNPIAFSGRIYEKALEGQPKYINSRDTILFKKDLAFFNLNQAKLEIIKKNRVILHEGQMDVLASYKAGLREAVCSLGTGFSARKASILAKYTKNIIICFDGDKAGIKASLKTINICKSLGFFVKLVLLPDGMDPDEFVLKNGVDAYLQFFESNIIDANEYIFRQAISRNLDDVAEATLCKNEIFQMLGNESNTVRDHYLHELSIKFNSTYQALLDDFNNYYNAYGGVESVDYKDINANPYNPVISETKKVQELKNNCELRLFMYAKSSRDKALYIDSQLNNRMEAMSKTNQHLWITLVNCFYENYYEFNEAAFIKMLSPEDVPVYFENCNILKSDRTPYNDADLNECLTKLLEMKYDKENEKLSKKIAETDNVETQAVLAANKFANRRKKEQIKKNRRN